MTEHLENSYLYTRYIVYSNLYTRQSLKTGYFWGIVILKFGETQILYRFSMEDLFVNYKLKLGHHGTK